MPIESNHYRRLNGGEAAGTPVRRDRHADLLHQWPQDARGCQLRRDQIHDRAGPAAATLVVLNEWIFALGSDKRKRRVNHLAREAYIQRLKGLSHVKITRLRLLGFKSFVEPTELLVEPG